MHESQAASDLKRLERLVSEKCNGSLTSDHYAELYDLLAKSAELRNAYWQLIAIHSALEWDLVGRRATQCEAICQLPEELLVGRTTVGARHGSWGKVLQSPWRHAAIAATLAAVLISGWTLWHSSGWRAWPKVAGSEANSHHAERVAAQLTPLTSNSRWSFGRPGDRNPKDFNFGDIVCVEEGLVEMQLTGGTIGQLRAPVVLQLLSQNCVRLLTGKIRVNAPARTDGFTVETPSAAVVDLGTEFSVEAAESGTDLIVFGGKVDLKIPRNGEGSSTSVVTSQQFVAGQAVRVDLDGTLSRIMNVKSPANPLMPEVSASSHVISKVVDNIRRDGVWAFYEIVWGGMGEDAYAFVDRFHEWNGITAAGMPAYLVGGDYVKMFNDDKIADEYTLEVTLSRPAALYVLLDSRVSPPKWLTDSFSDTGDRIGINESHHAEDGPGNNIDRIHSIWKQVVPERGTVVLGPNGTSEANAPWHFNMYGIVAVPLELVDNSAI